MRSSLRLAVAGCSIVCLAGPNVARAEPVMEGMKPMTLEVTITNLTKGQPFSPPIVVAHAPGTHLFEVGKLASPALQKLAEEGMNGDLKAMCEGKVSACAAAKMDEKIMPGKRFTTKLTCKPGDVLSVATMLGATNDAFTGVDSANLDGLMMKDNMARDGMNDGGMMMQNGMMVGKTMAYDAGTEENTEKKSDTAGPDMGKGHPATTPPQPISLHEGITGAGDLDPAKFGWDGPVAKIEVKMVK